MCGLGLLASVYLLRSGRRDQKSLTLVTIGGAITLAYAALFSTIEEQFLYFFYVPAILSLVVAATVIVQRARHVRGRSWKRFGMAAALRIWALRPRTVDPDPNDPGQRAPTGRDLAETRWGPLRAGSKRHDRHDVP